MCKRYSLEGAENCGDPDRNPVRGQTLRRDRKKAGQLFRCEELMGRMERVRIRIVSAEQGKCGASLDKGVEIVYDFHNHMNLNAMTGKTSLRAFQRAVGCCETVCGQMIYWPSSSQLKTFGS